MNGYKPRKRPKTLVGSTQKVETGCGNLYITVNQDEEGLFEVFAHLGKAGQCGAAQIESLCRCISAGLRSGVDPGVFVKQLRGIRCPSPGLDEGVQILSCADGIATALSKELKEKSEKKVTSNTIRKSQLSSL